MALDVGVHTHAKVHPAAQQIAVMIRSMVSVAESRIRFMVAAARAEVANPAGFTMRPLTIDRLVDEGAQALTVDAGRHVAEGRQVGARESMAQIEFTVTIDRQQPNTGPAWHRLAPSLVKIGH